MKTENYLQQEKRLPQEGKHILAQYDDDSIIVYQAFNPQISKYAVENQQFGGSHYKKGRMTWIKPNFMWMMYRAGWATKPNQECILAIRLKKEGFLEICRQAVYSSYQASIYGTHEAWKERLATSNVRLQWDPDHNPHGDKMTRKAIQLGIRGNIWEKFNDQWILEIKDITKFVRQQHVYVEGDCKYLEVPKESVFTITDAEIMHSIGINLH